MPKKIIHFPRAKGESLGDGNASAHRSYVEDALKEKVLDGRWLPADEYERQTGRQGRASSPLWGLGDALYEDPDD